MPLTKESVVELLSQVPHPVAGESLMAAGAVRRAAVCDGRVTVTLTLAGVEEGGRAKLVRYVENAIRGLAQREGETLVELRVETEGGPMGGAAGGAAASSAPTSGPMRPAASGAREAGPRPGSQEAAPVLPNVRHVIAVGAGKGGVGKSTVAVNLAVGLARKGHAVGLLDGDIYGPSLPTMMGLDTLDANVIGNRFQPFLVHGVKAMTIGKLVDPEKPLIWRGPMAHGAFKQLVEQTEWGMLDYLVIDLPPGTGDVALTMAQTLRLTGAVVVCTPQKVAQDDAIRALRMFQQLGIDVLGVVENMSYFIGDDGKAYDIFGRGGAQKMAQRAGVAFLGSVPINMALRANSDSGNPSANFAGGEAGSTLGRELMAVVESVESHAALAAVRLGQSTPTLTVS